MRQRNAEMPGAEKVRIASFSVTFGFNIRMADVVMMDFQQPASAEVDPQANHCGNQHTCEPEVKQALRWRFPLEMGHAHIGGVEFIAYSGKGKSRDLFPLRRWIHHTNADEHSCADDEHYYGVVQKVHVHQPADGPGIVMPGLIQHFENEAQRAEDKTGQQRTDGALPVQARPQNPENEAYRDRRTDVRLHALQIDIKLWAEILDVRHPQ